MLQSTTPFVQSEGPESFGTLADSAKGSILTGKVERQRPCLGCGATVVIGRKMKK
jgi:hypothetical protein